jgi:hypothetical protein
LNEIEYAIVWHYKFKGISIELFPDSEKLRYLELDWANINDLVGINKFKNLKRLELHYCTKLENDFGISSLGNTLEFLHINQSKKLILSNELFELKKLKVLLLNSCGNIDNLSFLKFLPDLIDFRFVDTNIIDGNLTPIIEHPKIKTVGFKNKRHYNLKDKKINSELLAKPTEEIKEFVYKGEFKTFRYRN